MADIVALVNVETYDNEDMIDTLTLQDSAGDPLDLTGISFECDVRTTADAADETYSLPVVAVGDPTAGIIGFNLPVDPTTKLNPILPTGTYVYDIVTIDGSGGRDTIIRGKIKVKRGVTRPPE